MEEEDKSKKSDEEKIEKDVDFDKEDSEKEYEPAEIGDENSDRSESEAERAMKEKQDKEERKKMEEEDKSKKSDEEKIEKDVDFDKEDSEKEYEPAEIGDENSDRSESEAERAMKEKQDKEERKKMEEEDKSKKSDEEKIEKDVDFDKEDSEKEYEPAEANEVTSVDVTVIVTLCAVSFAILVLVGFLVPFWVKTKSHEDQCQRDDNMLQLLVLQPGVRKVEEKAPSLKSLMTDPDTVIAADTFCSKATDLKNREADLCNPNIGIYSTIHKDDERRIFDHVIEEIKQKSKDAADDVLNLSRTFSGCEGKFKNKSKKNKRKNYFQKHQKLGYLPVQLENYSANQNTAGDSTTSLQFTPSMSNLETPQSTRVGEDVHARQELYASRLAQLIAAIDQIHKEELESMIRKLEEETASLQAEYEILRGHQSPSLSLSSTSDANQSLNRIVLTTYIEREMLAEAQILRQPKARLEARMNILKEDNKQLRAQLARLRKPLDKNKKTENTLKNPNDNGAGNTRMIFGKMFNFICRTCPNHLNLSLTLLTPGKMRITSNLETPQSTRVGEDVHARQELYASRLAQLIAAIDQIHKEELESMIR
ncbi:myb-like protein X [Artemia franciscana]|uniref:myb-like protein X n=1 Tax=Artemia franciscana TaxID=6661 RepID=UPI0032DA75E9